MEPGRTSATVVQLLWYTYYIVGRTALGHVLGLARGDVGEPGHHTPLAQTPHGSFCGRVGSTQKIGPKAIGNHPFTFELQSGLGSVSECQRAEIS